MTLRLGDNVTKVSAHMVNKEKIGVFQTAGEKNWWKKELPENVTVYDNFQDFVDSHSKGFLIISDNSLSFKTFNAMILENAVVYRPQTLVVGVGLHWDTSKETIKNGLESCLQEFLLSGKSIARFVSIKKEKDVEGLIELGKEMDIPIEYIDREELATITTPNPSKTVQAFEGTSSVSEAAALKSSGGKLIVEKQKFPPNLTIAIARIQN